MNQREVVIRLLKEAGSRGVSARTLIYEHGITRAAAIVHGLRHDEGMNIETVNEPQLADGRKPLARYVLGGPEKRSQPPAPPVEGVFTYATPQPTSLPCGCVRAPDGRSWLLRCYRHDPVTGPPRDPLPW
jgi:Helix-turn-helix domain